MKSITIVSKGVNTSLVFKEQLHQLLGHRANVSHYAKDHFLPAAIRGDVILLTTPQLLPDVTPLIEDMDAVVLARRSVNYHEIYKLFSIPPGTDVLLVNDMASTARETIAMLQMLNIDHLNYYPFYPGLADYPRLELAVTPGERQLVPGFVREIFDIQSRPIDITTVVDILSRLGLIDHYADMLSALHVRDIISLIRDNAQIMSQGNRLQSQLRAIINAVHDGIVSTDEEGFVKVFNPVAEELFSLPAVEALDRHLDAHERLAVLLDEKDGREADVFRKLHDRHVILNVTDIPYPSGKSGRVYSLKDVSEIRRLEESARRRFKDEHVLARYTFADIIGRDPATTACLDTARLLARSEATILLEGESGTGKELIAQSIHNASSRRNGPFIAVNLGAMTETLLESELFGYEPGAFTGATRSGSTGLFEAAHKGTIFLDEMGDTPLSFQVKLLRVLQERQIKKIGSPRVIPLDVRVMAATNRSLKALVNQGLFRADLYYRLNVLPLRLPPLRDRRQDIGLLAEYFYHKLLGRPAAGFFERVLPFLRAYTWPGNIRELQNMVEYLVNVSPDAPASVAMLPLEIRGQGLKHGEDDLGIVLQVVLQAGGEGQTLGRRSLARLTGLPESRVRTALARLVAEGKVRAERGRRGIVAV